MSPTKTAPYGSWKSPITSDLIVAQSILLSEVRLDVGNIYWLEGRPQEQGRYVVVRGDADEQRIDITPPPYNARTRVHDYFGRAYLWNRCVLFFSHFADQRLFRVDPGQPPRPISTTPPRRTRRSPWSTTRRPARC